MKDKESAVADKMAATLDELEFDAAGLQNGLLHAMLDLIKHMDKPWHKTPEEHQRDIIAQLDNASKHFVREAVALIRSGGATTIRALLVKYVDQGEITANLKISKFTPDGEPVDIVGMLHGAVGRYVLLTPAGADEFMAEGEEPETDPNEPGLEFDNGPDGDEFDAADPANA